MVYFKNSLDSKKTDQIILIKDVGKVTKTKTYEPSGNKKEITRKRFVIQTIVGTRIIEFGQYHFSN